MDRDVAGAAVVDDIAVVNVAIVDIERHVDRDVLVARKVARGGKVLELANEVLEVVGRVGARGHAKGFVLHGGQRDVFLDDVFVGLASLPDADQVLGHLTQFLMLVVSGSFVYALSVLLFWKLSGSPDGAESYLLDLIKSRLV